MKKLLSLLLALFASATMMAQIARFDGNLHQINGSGVTGAYTGYFDYAKKDLQVVGLVDSFSVKLSLSPQESLKPIAPTKVTSGIFYGSDDFKFFSLKPVSQTVDIVNLSVLNMNVYITLAQNLSNFFFKASGVDLFKDYTIVLNSGNVPVAYGTFTAIPEPATAAYAGASLLGLGLAFKLKDKKIMPTV